MAAPKFNPQSMDIFTKKGREKFDQYMKEKKLWEQQHGGVKKAKATVKKKTPKIASAS